MNADRFEETRTILRLDLTDMLNHYENGQNRENRGFSYRRRMKLAFQKLRKEYTAISLLQKPAAEIIQRIQKAFPRTVVSDRDSATCALPAETCKCRTLMQSWILSLGTQAKENLLARNCSGGSST